MCFNRAVLLFSQVLLKKRKRKGLSPISFVKRLLRNERCPPPTFFFSQGRMSSCCLALCLDEEKEEEEESDAFIRYITSPRANPLLFGTSFRSGSLSQSLTCANRLRRERVTPGRKVKSGFH